MFKTWNEIVTRCVKNIEGKEVASLDCIPALFQNIVTALIFFVGTVALFLIIFNGIKFITSRGDAKQIEEVKNSLFYVLLGLLLVLLSFLIINIISYVTGVECIKFFGFTCK